MELLIRHYEKLVLALSMLFLMLCLFVVSRKVGGYAAEARRIREESVRKISGGEVIPDLDMSSFNGVKSINDRRNLIHVGHVRYGSRAGLFMPGSYVLCKNPKCCNFMNFGEDACPFCRTANDPVGKEPTMRDDVDGDGIPDLVEQRNSSFLNFLNPDDGYEDRDGDGFFNNEEYKAGTGMDDDGSHPPLAALLRVLKVFRKNIPFVFNNIRTVGSDNKNDWKIVLKTGAATQTRQLNDKVGRFRLLAVADGGQEITVLSDDNEQYRLPAGKVVQERQFSCLLLFLASRDRSDLRTLLQRFRLLRKDGEIFELTKRIGDRTVSESYKLQVSGAGEVKVGRLDAAKARTVAEHTVARFDAKRDFGVAAARRDREPQAEGLRVRRGRRRGLPGE